jgi:hypothetical protein
MPFLHFKEISEKRNEEYRERIDFYIFKNNNNYVYKKNIEKK